MATRTPKTKRKAKHISKRKKVILKSAISILPVVLNAAADRPPQELTWECIEVLRLGKVVLVRIKTAIDVYYAVPPELYLRWELATLQLPDTKALLVAQTDPVRRYVIRPKSTPAKRKKKKKKIAAARTAEGTTTPRTPSKRPRTPSPDAPQEPWVAAAEPPAKRRRTTAPAIPQSAVPPAVGEGGVMRSLRHEELRRSLRRELVIEVNKNDGCILSGFAIVLGRYM